MKVYETTAGLGYAQKAYLIRLTESENGYDYLCIDYKNIHNPDRYSRGKVVKDIEDMYVEESDYNIKDSPLFDTFLFQYFLDNQLS